MTFKCKMCGGDIEPIKGTNTGKCLYCKSTMTLPNSDNEKIINLYNRANELRQSNEFDKAQGLYESILNLDNTQLEAQWGILLCKYGVEYVDDPKTNKKIPTCHKANKESILTTQEYKHIIKNAYGKTLELYEKEAKEINRIQKEILEISEKESPYDIFICYKETDEKNGGRTKDSVIAQEIYNELTKLNYKVFFSRITLEDKIGSEYEPYIYSALKSSKVMLVIGTSQKNMNSVWVKNEWSRYLDIMKKDRNKTLIPCFYGMTAADLPDEFILLQGQDLNKIGAIQDLIRGITKIIKKAPKNEELSDELFSKFKEMLKQEEELKRKEQEEEERGVEVKIYKEKCPKSYSIITFLLSAVVATFYIILISNSVFVSNNPTLYIKLLSAQLVIIFGTTSIIYFIAYILGFSSRKSRRISKYLYIINLSIFLLFSVFIYKEYNLTFNSSILGIYIFTIILILMNSKWQLKAETTLIKKQYAEEIKQLQKETKKNFEDNPHTKTPIIAYILALVISITLIFIVFMKPKNIGAQNTNENQILVTTDYINVRKNPDSSSQKLDYIFSENYYNVLEIVSCKNIDNCPDKDGLWYKIEYIPNKTGYVYSGYKSQNGEYTYSKYIPKRK